MGTTEYELRLTNLRRALEQQGLRGMVVLKPEHVRYFSGFTGDSPRSEYVHRRRLVALVLPVEHDAVLIVPKVERDWARSLSWVRDVRWHVEWAEADVPL